MARGKGAASLGGMGGCTRAILLQPVVIVESGRDFIYTIFIFAAFRIGQFSARSRGAAAAGRARKRVGRAPRPCSGRSVRAFCVIGDGWRCASGRSPGVSHPRTPVGYFRKKETRKTAIGPLAPDGRPRRTSRGATVIATCGDPVSGGRSLHARDTPARRASRRSGPPAAARDSAPCRCGRRQGKARGSGAPGRSGPPASSAPVGFAPPAGRRGFHTPGPPWGIFAKKKPGKQGWDTSRPSGVCASRGLKRRSRADSGGTARDGVSNDRPGPFGVPSLDGRVAVPQGGPARMLCARPVVFASGATSRSAFSRAWRSRQVRSACGRDAIRDDGASGPGPRFPEGGACRKRARSVGCIGLCPRSPACVDDPVE